MITLKQIEELIKLNRDNKSIKYVDEHKNPIEPTQNSIVEDIEHIERFNGGPFGGYSEHDFIITIKNENSLKNQPFIKHLLNKFDSKFTITSKILLLLYICSLFIPFPHENTGIISTLLYLYLSFATLIGVYLLLFLIALYLYFIPKQSSKIKQIKTILTVLITPIISYIICSMFNIITPAQLLSTLPLLSIIVYCTINFTLFGSDNFINFNNKSSSKYNFDFTKIKRIFLKK
jgi:hypothetical protein